MALLSATGLPLIVVITSIAIAEGRMLEVNAASLVAAGMLSVHVVPRHRSGTAPARRRCQRAPEQADIDRLRLAPALRSRCLASAR